MGRKSWDEIVPEDLEGYPCPGAPVLNHRFLPLVPVTGIHSDADGNGNQDFTDKEPDYDPASKKAPTVETTSSDNTITTNETVMPVHNDNSFVPLNMPIGPLRCPSLTIDRLEQCQRALALLPIASLRGWLNDAGPRFAAYHLTSDEPADKPPRPSRSQMSGCGATDGSSHLAESQQFNADIIMGAGNWSEDATNPATLAKTLDFE